ncbi:ABC transporter substrate-binding protein [Desulfoplanes sp. PS50]|jgi:glycine betaine/proline transport system substrate-binding protein
MFTNAKLQLMGIIVCAFAMVLPGSVMAETKKPIKIASVSWTGVTVKTELAVKILNSLGYEAENLMVSVPIAYKAMASGEAEFFLGNWMPTQETMANEYFKQGTVIKSVANMVDAKYTLAVPSYCYEAGLRDFNDIHKFADKLENRIYGIEEGNDGNQVILKMINNNMHNLGDFELIPSSAAGMLSQVQSFVRDKKWIVFLGWSPHYMNKVIDMKYLSGSNGETFGPNDGTATVYTNYRKGFDKEYPNVTAFLEQFTFPISMMNEIMTMMFKDDNLQPAEAGMMWVKAHPEIYRKWLDGITTVDGKPALPAFEAALR